MEMISTSAAYQASWELQSFCICHPMSRYNGGFPYVSLAAQHSAWLIHSAIQGKAHSQLLWHALFSALSAECIWLIAYTIFM